MGFCPPLGDGSGIQPQIPCCSCICHHIKAADYAEADRHEALADQREQPDRVGMYATLKYHAEMAHKRREDTVLGVDLMDPAHTALACDTCRGAHAVVFSGAPDVVLRRELGPPPEKPVPEPWTDAPRPPVTDGGSTDGEGAE